MMQQKKEIIYKKYLLIDKYRARFIVKNLCLIFIITKVSYYRWNTKGKPIFKIKFNEKLAKQIKDIYKFYNGIYGYLKITIILNNRGINVS